MQFEAGGNSHLTAVVNGFAATCRCWTVVDAAWSLSSSSTWRLRLPPPSHVSGVEPWPATPSSSAAPSDSGQRVLLML